MSIFAHTELVAGWQDLPVVLLASLATAPLLASELLRRPRLLVELPHDRFLLGYWAAIIVSDLAWGWREEAVLGAAAFAPIAYLYFLLRASLGTPRRFRGMMLVLTLAVVFHAVSGIVQYQTGIGFGGVAPLMYDGEERIQGPGVFNDPNDLGMAFVVVIPVVLARIQGPAPFVRRVADTAHTARVRPIDDARPAAGRARATTDRPGAVDDERMAVPCDRRHLTVLAVSGCIGACAARVFMRSRRRAARLDASSWCSGVARRTGAAGVRGPRD